MASEAITLGKSVTSGSYIQGKIEWSSKPDAAGNDSDVTASIYIRKGNDETTLTIPTSGTWSWSMTINGKAYSGTAYKDVLLGWVLLGTVTLSDIGHNTDGTKAITISGSVTAPSATSLAGHTTRGSGTATFDTIPRVSVPTLSASSVNFGSAITIYTNRQSSAFTHHLYYSVNGGAEVGITPDIGASFTWTVPVDLMSSIPNSKSATITFRLYTFSGGTNIGNNTISFTATVPDNDSTRPGITINSLLPVHSLPAAFNGLFVQGKSKVQADLTLSGKYGASIVSCVMSVEGTWYGGKWEYLSGMLTGYGVKMVTITAEDSRGMTNAVTREIEVLAYRSPMVHVRVCGRCDENGTLSDSGTSLRIEASRTYSKVESGGVQKNFCTIRYRFKEAGGEYRDWGDILPGSNVGYGDEIVWAGARDSLATDKSYIVQVGVVDTVGETSETTFTIPTAKVYMHRDGARRSLTFGGYVEEDNTFSIAEDIAFVAKGPLNGFRQSVTHPGCYYRIVDGEEEWLIPPMLANVEYRTTERFMGKPVYTKIISTGAMLANTAYDSPHEIDDIDAIWVVGGYALVAGSKLSLPYQSSPDGSYAIIASATPDVIHTACAGDTGTISDIVVIVKYTKTV